MLGALIVMSTNPPFLFLAAGFLLSLIPAIAGLWVIENEHPEPMADALIIFGWTLIATLTAALTGGGRSPALVLFVIGPFTALLLGNNRLVIEAIIFAALGYIGAAALSSIGAAPSLSEPNATLGGAAAAIGVAQTLLLIAVKHKDGVPAIVPATALQVPDIAYQAKRDRAAAEQKLQERTAYFASLSHDLRSPFTAILGYAEAFKMNLKGNLTDKQVDQASIIQESAEDLLGLVDDMMDLAKSEAGELKIDPEPLHLGDLGKAVMQQFQSSAERRNITFSFTNHGDPWAMGDMRLVRRIWQNLISNAIKYSNDGGTIDLAVSERSDQVVLSVEDHGRGMSEDDLARIAEPFQMGDNARDKSGTGLGLVNVKRFAEMHDGHVVIDTAVGEGARFQVVLPKADISDLEPL